MEFWSNLFDTSSFTPTSHSFASSKTLLAWYQVMTGIIALSYFFLATTLIRFARSKETLLWNHNKWPFILFTAFLCSRGISASLQVLVAYIPVYRVQVLWATIAMIITVTVLVITVYIFKPIEQFVKNMSYFVEAYITNAQIKARYKAVADLLPSPVFIADKEGKYIYVNKAYEFMVGGKFEEDIQGERWAQFIYDDDRGRLYNQWEAYVKTGRENWSAYARLENRHNEIIPVKILVSYLPTDYGYVGYINRLD